MKLAVYRMLHINKHPSQHNNILKIILYAEMHMIAGIVKNNINQILLTKNSIIINNTNKKFFVVFFFNINYKIINMYYFIK
jgi:hypothetical protein